MSQKIEDIVVEKGNGNGFNTAQWRGWVSTMINRINRVTANLQLQDIINTEENIVDGILDGDDEITIIEADFDRRELDILIFISANYFTKEQLKMMEIKIL